MKTYIITAREVKPLKTEIKAKDEKDALKQLNELLENGEMPEDGIGFIDRKGAFEN